MKIVLTFDVDWAPDYILEDTVSLLASYGVSATFFTTHNLPISLDGHEIGLHPNFLEGGDWERALFDLKNLYPGAITARAHSLTFGFRIFNLYQLAGIKLLSNYFMYKCDNLTPFDIYSGIVEFPIWFMDNGYVEYFGDGSCTWNAFNFEKSQLRVFAFHPIHVFLNTDNIQRYYEAKIHMHDQKKIIKYVNSSRKGIRSMLIDLLDFAAENNIEVKSISESFYGGWY